jgi:hypothetical protein
VTLFAFDVPEGLCPSGRWPAAGCRQEFAPAHWHHRCWYCGREHCDQRSGGASAYDCACGCGETWSMPRDDRLTESGDGFDPEFCLLVPWLA